MTYRAFAATLLAGFLCAGVASAQLPPPGGSRRAIMDISAEELAAILRAEGYQAKIGIDSDGDPKIDSAMDGTNYEILFYDCTKGDNARCKSYQFSTTFSRLSPAPTAESMNAWNEEKRFAQASVNNRGRARLTMNCSPRGTVGDDNFKHVLSWWKVATREFKQHIGFK